MRGRSFPWLPDDERDALGGWTEVNVPPLMHDEPFAGRVRRGCVRFGSRGLVLRRMVLWTPPRGREYFGRFGPSRTRYDRGSDPSAVSDGFRCDLGMSGRRRGGVAQEIERPRGPDGTARPRHWRTVTSRGRERVHFLAALRASSMAASKAGTPWAPTMRVPLMKKLGVPRTPILEPSAISDFT